MPQTIHHVPTNIITGFLGAGKSTLILNLLKQKPQDERWAVLVNEFGEVGIDGGLFGGQETEHDGVFIREVAGGCMCCTAGLPMQIALNMLIARAKPQRVLIEPTGLGHPMEVMSTLRSEHYKDVLDLGATLTLVDARNVHQSRYTEHAIFNQQLAIADVILASKADQYEAQDYPALQAFLNQSANLKDKKVVQVSHGNAELAWLDLPASHDHQNMMHDHHHSSEADPALIESRELPEAGYLCIDNEGEGFYSRGWIFKPDWVFDASALYSLLASATAERIKGFFVTNNGIKAYNKADDVLTEMALDECMDSRIECIVSNRASLDKLHKALFDCVITR